MEDRTEINQEDPEAMSTDAAKREIEALREQIDDHDYHYYVLSRPKISDARYDRLFQRLQALEDAFPDLRSANSPTRRVGASPVDSHARVDHAAPMLSLEAARDTDAVAAFHAFVCRQAGEARVEFVLEPKFDGLSVEIIYENGAFTGGSTRGNGRQGESITENLRTIRSLPLRLRSTDAVPDMLSIRGEVLMPRQRFQHFNRERIEKGQEPFANPRNAAAGTLRQLDPAKVAERPLEIVCYDILAASGRPFETHWQVLEQLERWGLNVCGENRKATSIDDIHAYHRRLADQRADLAFEIDGVVVKLNRYDLRERLGTRQRNPRWALAWKFNPKQEVTVLEDIVHQVGRTGMLTPVALLQPVDVGGVTISRATLHNADEVRRKDVRPGDTVRVIRAGDVIPEVEERLPRPGRKRQPPYTVPDACPACGSAAYREGAYFFCPAGLACRPQLVARIVHYASREALDINGLGEKTALDLVEKNLVSDIADLYRISVERLKKLDGFAERAATSLHAAIQGARRPRLDRFLYALGIRHVGKRTAGILAARYRTLADMAGAGKGDLENIEEIGPVIAASVNRFFKDERNRRVLERLQQFGVQSAPMPGEKKDLPLADKTVVFTGALDDYTRSEAEALVERLGGRAVSSVSGKTDYVVVGDRPGKTLEEARQHQMTILDAAGFQELIEDADGK